MNDFTVEFRHLPGSKKHDDMLRDGFGRDPLAWSVYETFDTEAEAEAFASAVVDDGQQVEVRVRQT